MITLNKAQPKYDWDCITPIIPEHTFTVAILAYNVRNDWGKPYKSCSPEQTHS